MPRYEFVQGTSNKFWEITKSGDSVTTYYGRIGSDGKSTTKSYADAAAATKEYDKLVASKTKKGYVLASGGGAKAAPKPATKKATKKKATKKKTATKKKATKKKATKKKATKKKATTKKATKKKATKKKATKKKTTTKKATKKKATKKKTTTKKATKKKATKKKAATKVSAGKSVYYEFVGGSSSKFWKISQSGAAVTTHYGRIGAVGSSNTKDYADVAAARKEYDKLIASKEKKGYVLAKGAKKVAAPAAKKVTKKKATAKKATVSVGKGGSERYEFVGGSSAKFWEITRTASTVTTHYGRLGANGQRTAKTYADDAAAQKEYDKLVRSKVKKGYTPA